MSKYIQKISKGDAESVDMDSSQLDLASKYVEQQVNAGHIPLGYVFVVRKGKIVLDKYFIHPKVVDQGIKIYSNSMFPIASVTKPLTATLAMKMVEMGNFSLDTPVAEYISEFGQKGKNSITPRHLLTHTSGLSDSLVAQNGKPKPTCFDEVINRICEQPLMFQPGTDFSYSTPAFEVLVTLIQKTSGIEWEQLSKELLFKPMAMTNSHFNTPKAPIDQAIPLFNRAMEIDLSPHDSGLELHHHFKFNMGGGNGISNPRDIAAFCQMMLNQGSYNNVQILSPVTVSRMTEPQFQWWDSGSKLNLQEKPDFVSQGLGWMVRNKSHYRGSDLMSPKAFFHGGAYGMRTIVDPEYDLITIFLTSAYHDSSYGNTRNCSYYPWLTHHHYMQQIFSNMTYAAIKK
ncbi:MAG: beta-lactamase family protein [SAR202 cluster bacterium]|nr:beta-lactamase family protein [SAR202 cluster bacterium]